VMVSDIAKGLCGGSRPHFFQGVATVVCMLFNIIKPDYAVFGEKDYQQLLVIKKMVKDLHMPVEIIGSPIVREDGGLAMSSRNDYLSKETRKKSCLIFQTLKECAEKLNSNETVEAALDFGINKLTTAGFKVDYFELRDETNLKPLTEHSDSGRLFAAVTIDGTRLIDNLSLSKKSVSAIIA